MVDINTEKLTNKIQEYRDDGKSCSQSVLTAICTELDCQLNENQLLGLGKGFSGGIGGTFDEGTCGALTGAIIAVGLLLPDEPQKNVAISKQLLKFFQEEYDTLQCGKLTDNGNDKSICDPCCQFVGEKFSELAKDLL
ncbi:MAG: C-GCAxxG-C-C family protein [Methanobacteriaceae archaeon]|nr:C-GCAxxG-C-C family protein [Methanobacteriaceae archaeon]